MRPHIFILAFVLPALASAHGPAEVPDTLEPGRLMEFPDTPGYLTLAVDLHTHSAFSDGHVWPTIRVEEAIRDGLDAIAITEHLEWRPHRADIPGPSLNRAYEEAVEAAEGLDLVVIPGSEITREMPVGHVNAIFISDANALFRAPPEAEAIADADAYYDASGLWPAEEVFAEAERQGAFMFWNHPAYEEQKPDGIAEPTAFHLDAFARNWIQGIEVSNGFTYSEEAFQIALDHGLAILGVSDVHGLIDWDFDHHRGAHRPVTLVFASSRSAEAIHEALRARRTVAWHDNLLLGRAEQLGPLLQAILVAGDARYVEGTTMARLTLENRSSQALYLENASGFSFHSHGNLFEVPAHGAVDLVVRTQTIRERFPLTFTVRNALVAPKQAATINFEIAVTSPVDLAED